MNQEYNEKRYEARYYVPKGIIKHYNVNGKNFYDQLNDCGIKQYKEIRKLTTGQGGDYTSGFLLDYEYLKSYDRVKAVDLNVQKDVDADPKSIHQIGFIGQ